MCKLAGEDTLARRPLNRSRCQRVTSTGNSDSRRHRRHTCLSRSPQHRPRHRTHDSGARFRSPDFEAQGAERIVLLDVDAALCKQATHAELIESLINATQIPVMAAGGLRTLAQIEGWFERGAGGAGHRGAHRSSFVGPGLRPPPSGHRRQPRH